MSKEREKGTRRKHSKLEIKQIRNVIDFLKMELSNITTDANLLKKLINERALIVKVTDYAYKEVIIKDEFFLCLGEKYYIRGDFIEIAEILRLKLDHIQQRLKSLKLKKTFVKKTRASYHSKK